MIDWDPKDGWYQEPEVGDLEGDRSFHDRHRGRPSFRHAVNLVNSWSGCESIIDVGSRSTGLLSEVRDDYKVRVATDIYKPEYLGFDTSVVKFIHGDFLIQEVGVYDVVVCLETLEHIRPDLRKEFAQKLLVTARKHLLISIPYMWKGSTEPVPHNDYNETHVLEWFGGLEPDASWIQARHYSAHYIREKS